MKKVFALLLTVVALLTSFTSCEVKDPQQTEAETTVTYPSENLQTALPGDIVAKTENTQIPALYLKYFFIEALSTFCQNYYQTLDSYFDVNVPLHDQVPKAEGYTEYPTWYDYFLNIAKSALEYHLALYEQAVKNSVSLTEDELKLIDSTLDEYQNEADDYDINFEEYMAEIYTGIGEGVTRDMMRQLYIFCETANKFAETEYRQTEFSDSEIEDYFNKNKYEYLVADYNMYEIIPDCDMSDSDEEIEKAKADADKKAKKYIELLENGATFMDAYKQLYPGKSDSHYKKIENECAVKREPYYFYDGSENISTKETEWLYDESRKESDYTSIKDSNGRIKILQVVRLPYRDDLLLPNIRVIYISLQDGTYTEKSGEAKATELVDQINGSEDKQSTVISLVKEYSKDTNTAKNDGLIESITPYYEYLPTDIVEWCYDDGRKIGDVMQSKYTYASVVTGYFVVYLDSFGDEYWEYNIKTDMKSMKMNELIEMWQKELNITYDESKTDIIYK